MVENEIYSVNQYDSNVVMSHDSNTSDVPHTSGNWLFLMRMFKPSKSDLNVCYDTLRSTYRWKWEFKLREFMQVLPVSAVSSADVCFLAMSVYTSARL